MPGAGRVAETVASVLWRRAKETGVEGMEAATRVLALILASDGIDDSNKKRVATGLAANAAASTASLARVKHGGSGLEARIDSFNSYYDPSLKKARRALLGSHGVFVVEGDINDGRLLAKLFDVVPFTHVLHLAAQAGCGSASLQASRRETRPATLEWTYDAGFSMA